MLNVNPHVNKMPDRLHVKKIYVAKRVRVCGRIDGDQSERLSDGARMPAATMSKTHVETMQKWLANPPPLRMSLRDAKGFILWISTFCGLGVFFVPCRLEVLVVIEFNTSMKRISRVIPPVINSLTIAYNSQKLRWHPSGAS